MSTVVLPHPLTSPRFWAGYWVTLRPYLFFVSGASGLLGLALAPHLSPPALLAAAVGFFLGYGLGQALTDVFQTDTDGLSSPYRPLVRGEIARGQVLAVSLAGLALCTLPLAVLNPWTLPVAALAVVGLATYTPLKRRWWGGPAWNSWIVACLPCLGYLCGGGTPSTALTNAQVARAMVSVFFSYAIFVVLGYFKDVEADRATGYETMPVRFGRRASALLSAGLLLPTTAASLSLAQQAGVFRRWAEPPVVAGLILALLGLVLLAWAHVRILPTKTDTQAHPAIALSVAGFVSLHLGEAALLRPSLAPAAVALFLLSIWILRRRPCRAQV